MKLFEFFNEKVGNYVCFQNVEGLVNLNFPPERCTTPKEVQEYTESSRIGLPGKIKRVGDDYLEIEYFTAKIFGDGVKPGFAGVKGTVVPFAKIIVNFRQD